MILITGYPPKEGFLGRQKKAGDRSDRREMEDSDSLRHGSEGYRARRVYADKESQKHHPDSAGIKEMGRGIPVSATPPQSSPRRCTVRKACPVAGRKVSMMSFVRSLRLEVLTQGWQPHDLSSDTQCPADPGSHMCGSPWGDVRFRFAVCR